jgi:hypothetical protein
VAIGDCAPRSSITPNKVEYCDKVNGCATTISIITAIKQISMTLIVSPAVRQFDLVSSCSFVNKTKKKNCYTNKKCIWNLIARLESNQRPTIMAPCPSDTFPREEIIDSNDALRVFEVCRSTAELRATKNDMRIAQFKNRSLGLRRAVTRVFFFIPTDDSSGTCGSDFLSF